MTPRGVALATSLACSSAGVVEIDVGLGSEYDSDFDRETFSAICDYAVHVRDYACMCLCLHVACLCLAMPVRGGDRGDGRRR